MKIKERKGRQCLLVDGEIAVFNFFVADWALPCRGLFLELEKRQGVEACVMGAGSRAAWGFDSGD